MGKGVSVASNVGVSVASTGKVSDCGGGRVRVCGNTVTGSSEADGIIEQADNRTIRMTIGKLMEMFFMINYIMGQFEIWILQR
jgi:hypothetical protein